MSEAQIKGILDVFFAATRPELLLRSYYKSYGKSDYQLKIKP